MILKMIQNDPTVPFLYLQEVKQRTQYHVTHRDASHLQHGCVCNAFGRLPAQSPTPGQQLLHYLQGRHTNSTSVTVSTVVTISLHSIIVEIKDNFTHTHTHTHYQGNQRSGKLGSWLTCLYSCSVMVPSLSVSCMLNKTEVRKKKQVKTRFVMGFTIPMNLRVTQASGCLSQQLIRFQCSCRHLTAQFDPPELLPLLLAHVQRWRPEVGHDGDELLKADLLYASLAMRIEVSREIR